MRRFLIINPKAGSGNSFNSTKQAYDGENSQSHATTISSIPKAAKVLTVGLSNI